MCRSPSWFSLLPGRLPGTDVTLMLKIIIKNILKKRQLPQPLLHYFKNDMLHVVQNIPGLAPVHQQQCAVKHPTLSRAGG